MLVAPVVVTPEGTQPAVAGVPLVVDRGGHVYRAYGSLGGVLVLLCPGWHIRFVAAAIDTDAVLAWLAQAVAGPARAARGGT